MSIVLATSNRGKVLEFKDLMGDFDIKAFSEVIDEFEIEESANSFKGNAIIKAQAVYDALDDDSYTVISDDSGISVPILNHEPGIYSARYAGIGASSIENLNKLISSLKDKNIKRTKAYYSCAICMVNKFGVNTVHGFMYGDVIDEAKGSRGFGYDPMFIPQGYKETVAQLDDEVKSKISHRAKAVEFLKILLG